MIAMPDIHQLSPTLRHDYEVAVSAVLRTPDAAGLMAQVRPGCTTFVFGTPDVQLMFWRDAAYVPARDVAEAHVAVTGCGAPARLNYTVGHDAVSGKVVVLAQVPGETFAAPKAQARAYALAVSAAPAVAGCDEIAVVDTKIDQNMRGYVNWWSEDWTLRRCDVTYHVALAFDGDADLVRLGRW